MTDVPYKGSDNIERTGHFNDSLGRLDAVNTRSVNLSNEDFNALTGIESDIALMKADIASLLSAFNTTETDIPHEALDAILDLEIVPFDFNTSGNQTIKGGTSGQTIRVHGLVFTNAAAVDITFQDVILTGSTTGDLVMQLKGAGGGLDRQGRPWFTLPAAADFIMTLGSAVRVTGWAYIKKG